MSLTSVDFGLRDILGDPKRSQEFFQAITEDEIAMQIRDLRKKRGLKQKDVAAETGMKQSAVSRIEQADYGSWALPTLFRMASVLRGRWKMTLQPIEEAVLEFTAPVENVQTATTVGNTTGIANETTAPMVPAVQRPLAATGALTAATGTEAASAGAVHLDPWAVIGLSAPLPQFNFGWPGKLSRGPIVNAIQTEDIDVGVSVTPQMENMTASGGSLWSNHLLSTRLTNYPIVTKTEAA